METEATVPPTLLKSLCSRVSGLAIKSLIRQTASCCSCTLVTSGKHSIAEGFGRLVKINEVRLARVSEGVTHPPCGWRSGQIPLARPTWAISIAAVQKSPDDRVVRKTEKGPILRMGIGFNGH
jgi:hypothetical protein